MPFFLFKDDRGLNIGVNYKKVPVEKMNLKIKKKDDERWREIPEATRRGSIKGSWRRIGHLHFIG